MAHGGPRRSSVSGFTAEGLEYEGGFTAESTEDTERGVESSKEGIRAEGGFLDSGLRRNDGMGWAWRRYGMVSGAAGYGR